MDYVIDGKTGPKNISLNRRKAIRERCLNCTGWSYKEVTDCSFSDCKLHAFRSGKGYQNPKPRNLAIRQYCKWCMNGQQSEVTKCPSDSCSLYPYRRVTNTLHKSNPIQRLFPLQGALQWEIFLRTLLAFLQVAVLVFQVFHPSIAQVTAFWESTAKSFRVICRIISLLEKRCIQKSLFVCHAKRYMLPVQARDPG